MEKDDQRLIRETLKGKLASFEVLVRKYQKQIYSHTLRLLNNHHDAQDATQEAFVRAFVNLKKFKIDHDFRPWIYQIATNYCRDFWQKRKRLVQLNEDVEDNKEPIIEKIIQKEEKKGLIKALRSLPDIYRLPLIGYYFQDYNYQNLAEVLDVPVNTLRTRLRRGKMILGERLR